MRHLWKDASATVLVAAVVVLYVGYQVRGELPFIKDPRGLAGAALILGFAACAVGGSAVRQSDTVVKVASVLGVVALALGVATLITESERLLAGFVGTIVLLWVLSTVRHVVAGRAPSGKSVGSNAKTSV